MSTANPFTPSDVAKVMVAANIDHAWLPSDEDAKRVMRAAISECVFPSIVQEFHLTDEGDYVVTFGMGVAYAATAPVSTRYLWRSGLRGDAAVLDMLTNVFKEVSVTRERIKAWTKS